MIKLSIIEQHKDHFMSGKCGLLIERKEGNSKFSKIYLFDRKLLEDIKGITKLMKSCSEYFKKNDPIP